MVELDDSLHWILHFSGEVELLQQIFPYTKVFRIPLEMLIPNPLAGIFLCLMFVQLDVAVDREAQLQQGKTNKSSVYILPPFWAVALVGCYIFLPAHPGL